ncbi:4Fe-4S dicluster domain-containing protein [Vibrio vulnificus]|uniref:4Fe-4S dicluster domain-containing protein n=1 Tax=Vibrio vulnificus TaxID=672 RepID=UPI00076AEC84|nr:4Fe-4S dicluster domain-containing protein [Vibrio vulnificus]AMG12151.1 (Fe-S)-binding protein [Vibrio vulnificus]EGR0237278.1 4Fe-4S dicluster domain-containing protein [Vibrio vulnificus]EGR1869678.1 4Fe-4S dicluster domain-containing protein [Vibrio vulnificus]EJE8694502.1 4Fe-4S dicluster domain-containing protein [Vibrio vulnificus]ELF4909128.1 4Fe-4S dicluster domain-containing protein [Vibrio vulnificus]
MIKQLLQQSTSTNGKARLYAFENTVELGNLIPPTVSYESGGNTLIVGPSAIIQSAAAQLSQMTSLTLLSTDGEKGDAQIYYADSVQLSGFLGTFTVLVENQGQRLNLAKVAINHDVFDVVLDLSLNGLMSEEVPVPGYYPVGRGYPKLTDALQEIPTLMGTFDKPKYFRLDTDLCAHSSRGVKGCERCVDACPAGALTSQGSDKTGHHIEINPYLCQGVGTCATSCPTEAIHYALPNPQETQKFIERTLANYESVGGVNPIILICSERHEMYNVMALKALPDNVIPIVVEDLPSVGIDSWFAALVNGATQVLFAASRRMPATIQRVLNSEVAIAQELLGQLGIAKEYIDILYLESLMEGAPVLCTEHFDLALGDLQGNKRQRLFTALDALATSRVPVENTVALSSHAPYGAVSCATTGCTLCMSCVAVCPTRALHTDGESPSLQFVEQDCVQCGLCSKACPEQVLTLTPRMNWDKESRQAAVVIHQEKAAECLRCHKPFAPQSMITMLQDKLRGHSHFANDAALNRIAMCEDCRVIDVFESMAVNPENQLNY